jgi:hypothetical protein
MRRRLFKVVSYVPLIALLCAAIWARGELFNNLSENLLAIVLLLAAFSPFIWLILIVRDGTGSDLNIPYGLVPKTIIASMMCFFVLSAYLPYRFAEKAQNGRRLAEYAQNYKQTEKYLVERMQFETEFAKKRGLLTAEFQKVASSLTVPVTDRIISQLYGVNDLSKFHRNGSLAALKNSLIKAGRSHDKIALRTQKETRDFLNKYAELDTLLKEKLRFNSPAALSPDFMTDAEWLEIPQSVRHHFNEAFKFSKDFSSNQVPPVVVEQDLEAYSGNLMAFKVVWVEAAQFDDWNIIWLILTCLVISALPVAAVYVFVNMKEGM